jgi:hypothetical protein
MTASHPYYKVVAVSLSVLLVSLLIAGAFDWLMTPTPEPFVLSSSKTGKIGFSIKPSPPQEQPAEASPPAIDTWSYGFLFNVPADTDGPTPSEPK